MRVIVPILALVACGAFAFAACVDGTTPDCSPGSGCEPTGDVDSGPGSDTSTGDTGASDTSVKDQATPDTSVADAPPG
jgi:hypothetical protein